MSVQQYIDSIAQSTSTYVLVAEIGIRNLSLIKRVAYPPDGICIGPWNPQADPRCRRIMLGDIGRGWNTYKFEAKVRRYAANGICQSILSGQNPGSCRKFFPAGGEVAFRNLYAKFCQLIARGKQTLLTGIPQKETQDPIPQLSRSV